MYCNTSHTSEHGIGLVALTYIVEFLLLGWNFVVHSSHGIGVLYIVELLVFLMLWALFCIFEVHMLCISAEISCRTEACKEKLLLVLSKMKCSYLARALTDALGLLSSWVSGVWQSVMGSWYLDCVWHRRHCGCVMMMCRFSRKQRKCIVNVRTVFLKTVGKFAFAISKFFS